MGSPSCCGRRALGALPAAAALALLSLAARGGAEEAASAVLGPHAVQRLAWLLSPSECRQLLVLLAAPEADVGPEADTEPEAPMAPAALQLPGGCAGALRRRLRAAPWDRLARGLRRVGRADAARELGKNLNQDRSLELRRNVEGYGRAAAHRSSALLLPGVRPRGARARRDRGPPGPPAAPDTRSALGWVWPLLSGVLGGFAGSVALLLLTVAACALRPGRSRGRRGAPRDSDAQ